MMILSTTPVPKASGGFSLVELIIAVAFTAIVVLAAGGATLASMRSNQISENIVIATAFAEDALECVRAHVADNRALPANCATLSTTCMPTPPPGFTLACVSPDPDTVGILRPNMQSVRVQAGWTGYRAGVVTLRTLID